MGAMLFPDVDHRSAWMRRLRDLIRDHVSDLGGPDQVSSSEAILIRRASMLTLQLEMMESKWAAEREGEAGPKSLELYQRTTGALRRTLRNPRLTQTPTRRDAIPTRLRTQVRPSSSGRGGGDRVNILDAIEDRNVFSPAFKRIHGQHGLRSWLLCSACPSTPRAAAMYTGMYPTHSHPSTPAKEAWLVAASWR